MTNVLKNKPPKVKQPLSSQEELDKIPQEVINSNLFVELKGKLYSIADEIESIGQICDERMQCSLKDYTSVLSNERNLLENETERIMDDLKFVVEKKKKETVPKYKNDLIALKAKVQKLGKDVQIKEKELRRMEYEASVFKEEDLFYANQLSIAEELNMYLHYKHDLISKDKSASLPLESNNLGEHRSNSCKNNNNTLNRVSSSNLLLTSLAPVQLITKKFNLNEKIMTKQLHQNRRDLNSNKSKYFRLAAMSENKYMTIFRGILNEVVANCQNNQIEKSKGQLPRVKSLIFQRSNSSSNQSSKSTTMLDESMLLTFREKKEMVIKFLETIEVKQLIYDVLYNDKSLPFPFNKIK